MCALSCSVIVLPITRRKESLRLTVQGFGSQSNVKLSVTGERIKAEKILCSGKVERR